MIGKDQVPLRKIVSVGRRASNARDADERLRLAMEVARVAAWEWNLATGQVTWSTDPEVLFGFPPGAFGVDRRLSLTLHHDDRLHVESAVAQALATGLLQVDYRIVRPNGSIVWITERGRMLVNASKQPRRIVGVSRDVTAERAAAEERETLLRNARNARDEAETQSRLRDEFLATLSHELRTPMNAILGWLSILESGKPIREVPAVLAIIRRNAEMQARLIDDLLDMNRLLSGNVALDLGLVDLGATLHRTVQALQPAADARRLRLMAVIDAEAVCRGDARRLQQVLWNLVHNAIKFTPAGGHVELRLSRADGAVHVSVSDSGRGIAPEFLPHVFDRFRQEDSSASRESPGLGLGLSIARHLVELHGGTIQARSAGLDRGATFVVTLPARMLDAGRHPSLPAIGVPRA